MALTRITQGVIKPGEDYEVNNINAIGIITATEFHGDGSNLTGTGIGSDTNINTTGIITATSFSGDGSSLTNVGGLGDPQSGLGNISYLFTSPELLVLTGIHTVNPPESTGKIVFTASDSIEVSAGSTLHISTGVTIRTNVLNLY